MGNVLGPQAASIYSVVYSRCERAAAGGEAEQPGGSP